MKTQVSKSLFYITFDQCEVFYRYMYNEKPLC